jgi:hypothetical protein
VTLTLPPESPLEQISLFDGCLGSRPSALLSELASLRVQVGKLERRSLKLQQERIRIIARIRVVVQQLQG